MQFDKGRFFQLFYSKLVGPVIRNCTVNCKTEVLTSQLRQSDKTFYAVQSHRTERDARIYPATKNSVSSYHSEACQTLLSRLPDMERTQELKIQQKKLLPKIFGASFNVFWLQGISLKFQYSVLCISKKCFGKNFHCNY